MTNANFQNAHPDFNVTTEKTWGNVRLWIKVLFPLQLVLSVPPRRRHHHPGSRRRLFCCHHRRRTLHADEVDLYRCRRRDDHRSAHRERGTTLPEISLQRNRGTGFTMVRKVLHPKTIRPVLDAGIDYAFAIRSTPAIRHALDPSVKSNGKVEGKSSKP